MPLNQLDQDAPGSIRHDRVNGLESRGVEDSLDETAECRRTRRRAYFPLKHQRHF